MFFDVKNHFLALYRLKFLFYLRIIYRFEPFSENFLELKLSIC